MEELLDEFLAETDERLDALTSDLVAWEKSPADRVVLDRIFRFFHTIKGSSGFLDLPRIGRLSHAAETALTLARDETIIVDRDFVGIVLKAADHLRAIVQELGTRRVEPQGDDDTLIKSLDALSLKRQRYAASLIRHEPSGHEPSGLFLNKGDRLIMAGEPPHDNSDTDKDGVRTGIRTERQVSSATVRVAVPLLDRLMVLASELVLARNALVRAAHAEGDPDDVRLNQLSATVTEIQYQITRTRMQPVGALWTHLPRLVRDVSQQLGKEVQLKLDGGDAEIDRQLLEAMRDPISHMVRNAIDHGIETPHERLKASKPMQGVVQLSAYQSDNRIVIEMTDDGRGIDTARLRAKAQAMGSLSPSEVAALSDDDALALMFEPGLSTASSITTISGRGVGMDVVHNCIKRIGGSIQIVNKPRYGTRFVISLPLTLTIVSALIVRLGPCFYAIPQSLVHEILWLREKSDFIMSGNQKMVRTRSDLVPVVDLHEVFDFSAHAQQGAEKHVYDMNDQWGVVVKIPGIGLVTVLVDAIRDQKEIVLSPVSPLLAIAGIYSGVAVLGDGEPVLLLDLPGLVERAAITRGGVSADKPEELDEAVKAHPLWIAFETAGAAAIKALPIDSVIRIENAAALHLSHESGRWNVHYDGILCPVVSLDHSPFTPARPLSSGDEAKALLSSGLMLIVDDGGDRIAIPIARVVDILSDPVQVDRSAPANADDGGMDCAPASMLDAGEIIAASRLGKVGAPRLILLAGNRQLAGTILKPMLESAGHRVVITATVAEAEMLCRQIEAADGLTFDLIMMEEGGTVEAATTTPILYLTKQKNGEQAASGTASVNATVPDREALIDPYDKQALFSAIDTLAGEKRAQNKKYPLWQAASVESESNTKTETRIGVKAGQSYGRAELKDASDG